MQAINRVVVIGLDGIPPNLFFNLTKTGRMPHLNRLIVEGVAGELASFPPFNSPTAWSTIITGKNPGKHGIFDFFTREEDSYDLIPQNASFRKGMDVWQILSEYGKRVIVVNVPFSYPPRKVNGSIISGFMTPPNSMNSTYPTSLRNELIGALGGFRFHPEEVYYEGGEQTFLDDLYQTTQYVAKASLYLMENFKWDFFMVVFFDTDRILHGLWRIINGEDTRSDVTTQKKLEQAVLSFFQRIDEFIAAMLDKIDDSTPVIILSDHGMGPLYNRIHVNNILIRSGLLKLKRTPSVRLKTFIHKMGITPLKFQNAILRLKLLNRRLSSEVQRNKIYDQVSKFFLSFDDVDWSTTKAFAFGTGQLFLNVRGREPEGCIDPDNFKRIREEAVGTLLHANYRGERIFKKVIRKEEIYEGPEAERSPDLLLLPEEGYDIFSRPLMSHKIVTEPVNRTADHREHGILLLWGYPFRRGVKLSSSIVDITPTVLYLLGVPIPEDIDGNVMSEAMRPAFLLSNPIRYRKNPPRIDNTEIEYADEEREEIMERLKKLGYL